MDSFGFHLQACKRMYCSLLKCYQSNILQDCLERFKFHLEQSRAGYMFQKYLDLNLHKKNRIRTPYYACTTSQQVLLAGKFNQILNNIALFHSSLFQERYQTDRLSSQSQLLENSTHKCCRHHSIHQGSTSHRCHKRLPV